MAARQGAAQPLIHPARNLVQLPPDQSQFQEDLMHQRLQSLHKRFGTVGLIVAITALILALGGTALAASGALTGKQKKEVEKIAKKFQGTGPAGSPGAKGSTGAAGSNGTNGSPGANGTNGANGTSVTSTHLEPGEGPTGEECEEGGTEFTSASGTEVVCNGEEGSPGPAGPTCNEVTHFCELPAGATETGTWQFQKLDENGSYPVNISFPLRLASAPAHREVVPPAGSTPNCEGSAEHPKAKPGTFCLYISEESNIEEVNLEASADPTSGAEAVFSLLNAAQTESAHGSWAVTSP
jgi:hypothetical protein